MKDKIYKILPHFMQGLLISLYNYLAYKDRYGLKYKAYFNFFKKNRHLALDDLQKIQQERFHTFLSHAIKKSAFYRNYSLVSLDQLDQLPIIKKEDLRQHIHDVYTVSKTEGIISKTGGTTGKSLEVLFTKQNMQERFALLDDFRNRFGYQLGKKTAWFSGKDLLTHADVEKDRFWKTDWFYKVRYYSTFHIKDDNLKYYIEDLIKYKPEYFVGFPSTILELAKYGLKNGYDFPKGTVRAIFPTAETITSEMRIVIEKFFKTKMYNQYASSEGAPFIFECEMGKLHLELQSGVFEILDDDDRHCNSGRLVITSFTTMGTPLIRYDIGDSISLEDSTLRCTCGNNNPLVKEILGRIDDYIYSPENGKVNLGNVSNTLKDTKGIIRFQAIQNDLNTIELLVIKDDHIYTDLMEGKFLQNWKDRIGNHMNINIKYVKDIPVEKSGKYRIVKNNIKHLI
jgi:phenylacetate-CoA ligase